MLESQLNTPALVVDIDIMEKNMALMEQLCKASSVALRPHYKSHKCAAIAHIELARGAKGITASKLSEAEDAIDSGVEDVLIANQLTEGSKIARAAYLAKCCRLTVCVDTGENIRQLSEAASLADSTVYCLVEFDVGMNRCGVKTKEEFLALAKAVEAAPHLVFEGIQAYAGNLAHCFDAEKRQQGSIDTEAKLRELKAYVEAAGLKVKEVSGVSTGTIGNRPHDTVYTEAQAGSYIFMDATYGSMNLGFGNSLSVLASVIHAEQDYIVTDAGVKSVSMDQNTPVFREYPSLPINFSEEHSAIAAPGKVGDKLHLIPGHCCTTVNLYDWVYFIRNGKVVDRIAVTARGNRMN